VRKHTEIYCFTAPAHSIGACDRNWLGRCSVTVHRNAAILWLSGTLFLPSTKSRDVFQHGIRSEPTEPSKKADDVVACGSTKAIITCAIPGRSITRGIRHTFRLPLEQDRAGGRLRRTQVGAAMVNLNSGAGPGSRGRRPGSNPPELLQGNSWPTIKGGPLTRSSISTNGRVDGLYDLAIQRVAAGPTVGETRGFASMMDMGSSISNIRGSAGSQRFRDWTVRLETSLSRKKHEGFHPLEYCAQNKWRRGEDAANSVHRARDSNFECYDMAHGLQSRRTFADRKDHRTAFFIQRRRVRYFWRLGIVPKPEKA